MNLVGWEKIPWRLAAVLGAFTKENQRANPRTIPNKDLSAFSQTKYKFFLEAPFEIAPNCCTVMKKKPSHDYCKKTGRNPISAQMASESRLRIYQWLRNGCNGFDLKYPMSNPMAFWESQDVLLYIRLNNLPIAPVYGKILTEDEINGQTTLFPYDAEQQSKLFAPEREKLYTTGCSRTGCVFCGFGCHLEKPGEGRFVRLKETHPQLYKYLFDDGRYKYKISNANGSEIDVRRVDREILERWVELNENNTRFHIDKTYVPDKGLGYKHIIDWINENGNFDIKY